jgi:hypothetical protein
MTQETDWIFRQVFDEIDNTIDVEAEPVLAKFLERRAFEVELEKTGDVIVDRTWSEPIAASAPRFTNPLNFAKGSLGFKLQITRQERKVDANGETWLHGYAGDELVDARVLE